MEVTATGYFQENTGGTIRGAGQLDHGRLGTLGVGRQLVRRDVGVVEAVFGRDLQVAVLGHPLRRPDELDPAGIGARPAGC